MFGLTVCTLKLECIGWAILMNLYGFYMVEIKRYNPSYKGLIVKLVEMLPQHQINILENKIVSFNIARILSINNRHDHLTIRSNAESVIGTPLRFFNQLWVIDYKEFTFDLNTCISSLCGLHAMCKFLLFYKIPILICLILNLFDKMININAMRGL